MLRIAIAIIFFFLYSFLGWCAETAVMAIRGRGYVNRGFLLGPCVLLYGVCATILTVFFEPGRNHIVWVCVAGAALYFAAEFITGFIMENHFHAKWWDYSAFQHTLKGYVWVEGALLKGVAIAVLAKYAQPACARLLMSLPPLLPILFAAALAAAGAADFFISYVSARRLHRDFTRAEWFILALRKLTRALRLGITGPVIRRHERHLRAAYPDARDAKAREVGFAKGLSAAKLFLILTVASLAGCLIEVAFMYLTTGVIMSRSSLLYGPFSMVWGIGAVLLTVVLHPLAEKSDRHVLFGGMLLGGAFEYACSVVTERLFGAIFWDYSKIPFNLNGRVNLLFCVFWGVLSLVWIKGIYPRLSRLIERIPGRVGRPVCIVLAVLLALDSMLSAAALIRMQQRLRDIPATDAVARFLDETYPDDALRARYPNMKDVLRPKITQPEEG